MIRDDVISIRELTINAADGFLQLKKIGLSTDPNSFIADISDDPPSYLNEVRKRINNASAANGDIILGAFKDKLIGIVSVTRNKSKKRFHKAELHGMYIIPQYRGIGLGKKLLESILEISKEMKGLEEIELIVAAHNDNVVKLYENFGFKKTYLEKNALKVDNGYIDAYHMHLLFEK